MSTKQPVHVRTRGEGPDVVLLHGLPEDPADLERLADALPEFRTHVVHLPGYGRSVAVPAQGLSTREVLDALEGLGIERAFWVGMSAGFYRAMTLVRAGGLEARGLVGLGPAFDFTPEKRQSFAAFAAALEGGADLGEAVVAMLYSPDYLAEHPKVRNGFLEMFAAVPVPSLLSELRAFEQAPDLGEWLTRSGIPTYIRVGLADQSGVLDTLSGLDAHPTIRIDRVEGVGHMLLDEDFAASARSVRAALR